MIGRDREGVPLVVRRNPDAYDSNLTRVVQAIYQGGMLRLLEAVALHENERVEIEIRTNGDSVPDATPRVTPEELQEIIARIQRLAEASGFSHSGPDPTRDELHDRS